MRILTFFFTSIALAAGVSGCFSIPDGEPPKGPIVNISFGAETLTEERAVEAMIAKFSNAALQSGLNGKTVSVSFNCDAKLKQMSMRVLQSTAPMLNLRLQLDSFAKNGGLLVCSGEKQSQYVLWTITYLQNDKSLFKIGTNFKAED